jgi:hypothetical protein
MSIFFSNILNNNNKNEIENSIIDKNKIKKDKEIKMKK